MRSGLVTTHPLKADLQSLRDKFDTLIVDAQWYCGSHPLNSPRENLRLIGTLWSSQVYTVLRCTMLMLRCRMLCQGSKCLGDCVEMKLLVRCWWKRLIWKVTPCASWLQWLSCTARKRNLPTGFGNSRIWCCTSVLMDLDTVTLVYCPERNLPTGFGNSRTWCLYECVVSKSKWWLDVAWWEKLSLKTLTAKKQTPSVKIDTVTGAPDCSFNYVCYNR